MILQVAQAFGEICPIVIVGWLYTSFFKGLQMIGFIPPEPEDCNHLQPPHYRRTQTIHMTGIFAYSYHKKSTMHVGKICPAPWLLWIISSQSCQVMHESVPDECSFAKTHGSYCSQMLHVRNIYLHFPLFM